VRFDQAVDKIIYGGVIYREVWHEDNNEWYIYKLISRTYLYSLHPKNEDDKNPLEIYIPDWGDIIADDWQIYDADAEQQDAINIIKSSFKGYPQ
jgi:hypothetical protein